MDRNISVVKDVFITCVLVSPKVSSAIGKQHGWCREISDQCSCLVTTMERKVCDRGRSSKHNHSCLEEGCYGI